MIEYSRFIRVPLLAALMGLLVSLTAPSQAATWYVRPAGGGSGTGWGDALGSFQAAINSATAGDEIWGASGVYNESLTLKAGIALYGGFAGTETSREDRNFAANPTILDATGLNQRVITADGTDGVTIDGFTIRNGRTISYGGGIYFKDVSSATASNCTITANTADFGGGVYCLRTSPRLTYCTITDNTSNRGGGGLFCYSSSPTLAHCTISGNMTEGSFGYGGGVYCSRSSSPTLTHCTMSGNTATRGGGVDCSGSSPTLTHCIITGNTAMGNGGGVNCTVSSPTLTSCMITGNKAHVSGGGVSCDRSSPTFSSSTISTNTANGDGGGIYSDGASPTLISCSISGNTANGEGGGVYSGGSSPSLSACTISGNTTSSNGGGVFCSDSSPMLNQCTLTDNTADDAGSGVLCYRSTPMLTNCILWNPGNEISVVSGEPVIRFSCVQGGNPGEGNIHGYPLFVDPLNGDWRLRDESPCIDRGIDVGLPFKGIGPDMGSWEAPENYSQGPPDHVPQIFRVNHAAPLGGDGLSWKTAFPSLREALFFSSNSDEIWVAAGTYNEAIHLEMGLTINAGFAATEMLRKDRDFAANPTVLDATGLNRRVITADRSEGVTIDGFVIRNGHSAASGGGIYFTSVSCATVSNCAISDNTANSDCGGVYFSNSSPTLTDCSILDNTATGSFSIGGGVYCINSSPTLTNCTISGNSASSGGGVYCSYSSSPTLTNCMISANSASSGGGVYCNYSSSPTLTHCAITGNTSDRNGGGVYCSRSSPMMTHCTISGNTGFDGAGGVYCSSSSPTLTNCLLWNPGMEIHVQSGAPVVRFSCVQGGYPGEDNINAYPHFVDPLNGNWRLRDGSPCIDRGVDVGLPYNGIGPDMGAWEAPEPYSQGPPDPVPQRFHVAAGAAKGGDGLTWETAFSSVGEAVLHSSTAVEIWVAAGTYNESIHIDMGSVLYGGFAGIETVRENRNFVSNPTILDATGLHRRVVMVDQSDGVTIDGFTIRNGNSLGVGGGIYFYNVSSATVSNCTVSGNTASDGGGVYCVSSSLTLTHSTISGNTASDAGGVCFNSSSSLLTNCTISGNTSDYGGGVACFYSSLPRFINCMISANTANIGGGGIYCYGNPPTLINCTITLNTANVYGGGVCCLSSSPMLTHCTVSCNTATYGGGVYYAGFSLPTLTQCTILGNMANRDGGGVCCEESSSPTVTNCTITRNTANRDGGGIHSTDGSSPTLTHCTIADNTAIGDGAGLASLEASSPTLINSILWNGADEVFLNSATAEVTFSAVQGGYPGLGNIDADPMFVDPEQLDYRLSMGSPCIDSGSNGAVLRLGPSVMAMGDHDGRTRIWDGDGDGIAAADMGAYEFGPPPFVGDVFADSRVSHLDLFRFQQVWKEEGEGALPEADQDGDRSIGAADLVILLHTWGNATGP